MNITRDQALTHLRRGFPVLVNGREVLPTRMANGAVGQPERVPADGEFQATRNEDGTLSRAGMVAIINRGEGIIHGNGVITDVKDLPSEDVLAAGDVARLEALKKQQDDAVARLLADNERTAKELDRARIAAEEAKKAPAKQPTTGEQMLANAPKLGGAPAKAKG